MKGRMFALLMVALLVLGIPIDSLASEVVVLEYFGVESCISCVRAEKHIEKVLGELMEKGYTVEFVKYNITNVEAENKLISYNNALGIKDEQYKLIPAVFVGELYLIDYEDIEERLEDVLLRALSDGYSAIDANDSSFRAQSLTLGAIMGAGLIDGVNPCSIAMMLFFLSIAMADIENKKKNTVIKLGLSFSLGVFVAYLGIGIGLFNFIYALSNLADIMLGFYLILFFMGLVLFILNIKDYINIKNGNEGKIKNQLSKKMKKRIHNFIKKTSRKKSTKIHAIAFVIAFVISFMEFFCTGQIYLPTITYMIKNTSDFSYLFLLIMYNVAFVSPLLLISLLMEKGKEVIDISSILLNKLHIIKLVGAIFFVIVMIYSIQQINTIM